MGPGRASEQKRRRADVEDVVETSRHKRARTWSPSLPGCGTSLSVPAQPVLNQFGLFLNDVAYIKRLPGVRHDATFEENCPAFTQGLANIRQESKRLGRKMDFMQHAPNTGTIRGLYECLLRELQSRVVSPSGAQHSLVTVVTSKGPSKASPIPAPDQLSEKLLAAVIEKHKKQLRVQNKAVTVRSEVGACASRCCILSLSTDATTSSTVPNCADNRRSASPRHSNFEEQEICTTHTRRDCRRPRLPCK